MGDFILLADKNSKSWEFAQKIQNYIQTQKEYTVPLEEVEVTRFRNGELGIHVPNNIRKKSVYFIHDSTKDPQQWWVELILIKDLLLSSSAKNVSFVIPNLLYSRQDRKDRPRVPISARALADSISPGSERIITMDLHAGQIQGFYPAHVPADNLDSFPELVRYLRTNHQDFLQNLVVVSPDVGAAGRSKKVLQHLEKAQKNDLVKNEFDFAIMNKTRSKAGEVGSVELVGNVEGKNVLIPDDIIDSGNTLCEEAKFLKTKGAKKLICYGTHGIFTKGTEEICRSFDVVLTSNTHYQKSRENIGVIDVSSIFAEAIYRAHLGLSISKLFE